MFLKNRNPPTKLQPRMADPLAADARVKTGFGHVVKSHILSDRESSKSRNPPAPPPSSVYPPNCTARCAYDKNKGDSQKARISAFSQVFREKLQIRLPTRNRPHPPKIGQLISKQATSAPSQPPPRNWIPTLQKLTQNTRPRPVLTFYPTN